MGQCKKGFVVERKDPLNICFVRVMKMVWFEMPQSASAASAFQPGLVKGLNDINLGTHLVPYCKICQTASCLTALGCRVPVLLSFLLIVPVGCRAVLNVLKLAHLLQLCQRRGLLPLLLLRGEGLRPHCASGHLCAR